jgi:hypothetical protein
LEFFGIKKKKIIKNLFFERLEIFGKFRESLEKFVKILKGAVYFLP